MKDQKLPPLTQLDVLYLSFFGVGFSRYAPGTMGSLATLPLLFVLAKFHIPAILMAPIILLGIGGSCVVADSAQRKYHCHDPGWIVIDEVLGMLVAYLVCPATHLFSLLLLFLLFRLFDIKKIFPATVFDRMKHGAGTILDDVISGIYAGVTAQAILYFWPSA